MELIWLNHTHGRRLRRIVGAHGRCRDSCIKQLNQQLIHALLRRFLCIAMEAFGRKSRRLWDTAVHKEKV